MKEFIVLFSMISVCLFILWRIKVALDNEKLEKQKELERQIERGKQAARLYLLLNKSGELIRMSDGTQYLVTLTAHHTGITSTTDYNSSSRFIHPHFYGEVYQVYKRYTGTGEDIMLYFDSLEKVDAIHINTEQIVSVTPLRETAKGRKLEAFWFFMEYIYDESSELF